MGGRDGPEWLGTMDRNQWARWTEIPNLSKTVATSQIWKQTLAQFSADPHAQERGRLRSSFESFRERAAQLAVEIGRDLPDLTIHDVSHLDSLWEVASQVCGEEFHLTPTEGYVLGGAILLHDLAMSVAATPGGLSALKKDPRWADTVYAAYLDIRKEPPSAEELDQPSEAIRKLAIFSLLRQLHAENAEKLAFSSFGNGAEVQFLIEDTELRQTFGRVIGQIAHSHWWSVGEVEKVFDRLVGAPHWAPPAWTIDPLKIACILRVADAAHIDARRAPRFQKAFSSINAHSRVHWSFQERINKAYLSEDALVFTSGQAFPLEDANAWWLCLDTLRMIDRELRSVDSLLADRGLTRFAAKRVAGVDLPERMAMFVQTAGWHPINATVHISDLPQIIRSLGGEELYGKRPRVPLRELIQNASDAIRARRYFENRPKDFGEINVSLTEIDGAHYLKVADNGVGMSKRVLTEFLLDFGSSFWSKPQVQEEFPGLASSGFGSTGKYGIGFFSVFMAADKVTVFTRRPDAAASDTLVLEFGAGLYGRPILRPAQVKEQLRDGGTVVQLLLRQSPFEEGGLFFCKNGRSVRTLPEVCLEIAPSLDTAMYVYLGEEKIQASRPDDWITLPGKQFFMRLMREHKIYDLNDDEYSAQTAKASLNLRAIFDSRGKQIARACIVAPDYKAGLGGAVTVGGFAASPLQGIAGIIIGESTGAARDQAEPLVPRVQLAAWANEQAELVTKLYDDPKELAAAAQVVRQCGGNTGVLPIALNKGVWISAQEIEKMELPSVVIVIDHHVLKSELKHAVGLNLDDNVIVTNSSSMTVVFQPVYESTHFDGISTLNENKIPLMLVGAVFEAIAISWGIDLLKHAQRYDFYSEEEIRVGEADAGAISVKAKVFRRPQFNLNA